MAETYAIATILVINAMIGFFQEHKAETAIQALREITAPRAKVLRDGRQTVIAAHDIVPGDLLLVEPGDVVAADASITEASRLQVNEAVLTGESLPAEKQAPAAATEPSAEKTERLFMGTAVATGTASAVVTQTGMQTELGKIAHLMASAENEPTPLQKQLARLGKALLFVCLAVVAVVAILGLLQGKSWLELFIFSVSLAVAAVPEGMPAIVNVALALGVQRLSRRNALIRKLPSVETLGSVSVLCTDKTGTLTTGAMRVRELWGKDETELLRAAASCCDAELGADNASGTGDPTEIAILIAAAGRDLHRKNIEEKNARISTEPFDAVRKRMSILRTDGINYVKGAIESLLPLCTGDAASLTAATQAAAEMSARGLRTLAVATGHGAGEQNLKLIGVIAIADPPRAEAMQAIKEARAAGIMLIMITGDHPNTAAAIARELGLIQGDEVVSERVYARATPEDKLKLVRSWKQKGAVVAMIGDGVNDAPALREAHIGIAMGKAGTEVTRQAADLILGDDNFATVVVAVKEARGIFRNIRNAIGYLLTGNLAEITIVLGAMILGLPLPLLAAHLLWINLVTDALPALTLVIEPLSPNVMQKPPRSATENILRRQEWLQIIWLGMVEAGVSLGLFYFLLQSQPLEYARSIMLTTFVFSQILRVFGARSHERVLWEVGIFSNRWLVAVAAFTAALQISLHYLPITQQIFGLRALTASDFLVILPFALIPISAMEIRKLALRFYRASRPNNLSSQS